MRPLSNQLIDGLCSLLTLADEAGTVWSAEQMAEQIRDIIGGPTDDGLWKLSLKVDTLQQTV